MVIDRCLAYFFMLVLVNVWNAVCYLLFTFSHAALFSSINAHNENPVFTITVVGLTNNASVQLVFTTWISTACIYNMDQCSLYLQHGSVQLVFTTWISTACIYNMDQYSLYLQHGSVQLVFTTWISTACIDNMNQCSLYLQNGSVQLVFTTWISTACIYNMDQYSVYLQHGCKCHCYRSIKNQTVFNNRVNMSLQLRRKKASPWC